MDMANYLTPVKFSTLLLAAICLLGATALNLPVCSAESGLKGYYRMMVGDFEVIALSDGVNQRSVDQQLQMLQGEREKIRDLLLRAYPDGQIEAFANAYLINTGNKRILVDTGNGKMGSPTMGNVVAHLRAAEYPPESIDEIYLTHMHPDHVGGLVEGGERVFTQATVYANKVEAEYWLDGNHLNAAPDDAKRSYRAAIAAITPYSSAGRFKTFDGSVRLSPGIRAEPYFGHTPGHTVYFVESQGATLVLWGDIVHVAAVQFADPAVTISFDSDRTAAAKARQDIFAAAAANNWIIGGAHIAFPGFGQLRANPDQGYTFLPLDQTASK